MSDRTELKRQLAETRAQMERLEAELEQKEQWEPEGGRFYIANNGEIANFPSTEGTRKFGTERPTASQAERARDLMRVHNRALAYVQEHAPDWDGSKPHALVWGDGIGKWMASSSSYLKDRTRQSFPVGAVIGPEGVIHKLAEDLNSGRVKL